MDQLSNVIEKTQELLPNTIDNIKKWLKVSPEWVHLSIQELLEKKQWAELNNRFFKDLEFGTGGMRSRTIGSFVTRSEKGTSLDLETPEHAAVGNACLNDLNIVRATMALFRYCTSFIATHKTLNLSPLLIIAHDVRHFSEYFSKITAKTWNFLGGEAKIFDGPRSTPQLSFSVRHFEAIAGIVITASHNPFYDNGYKVYFRDGGQVVDPHASGITKEFQKISLKDAMAVLEAITAKKISITSLPKSSDLAYIEEIQSTLLDQNIFKKQAIEIVFTPIHGTGDIAIVPALKHLGIQAHFVEEQMTHDPNFSTVTSPNPENFDVFNLAIQKANSVGANIVIGTDPDGDRIALGVRSINGDFEKFTGNLTGALLAEFRLRKMKKLGWLPQNGSQNAALIKTFVTTPLQDEIAKKHGIKCINTLTGFKWIAEKLNDYERQLISSVKKIDKTAIDLKKIDKNLKRELFLKYSTFFVLGAEESYGYLASDNVRDKDANAAALMICEMLASLKLENRDIFSFRNEIFENYGYFDETQLNIYYEGASGSEKIKNILYSYQNHPPRSIANYRVDHFVNFNTDTVLDSDGKKIPKQSFLLIDLDNGVRCAIRGSGTEPKIKFYLFGHSKLGSKKLQEVQKEMSGTFDELKTYLKKDAEMRSK